MSCLFLIDALNHWIRQKIIFFFKKQWKKFDFQKGSFFAKSTLLGRWADGNNVEGGGWWWWTHDHSMKFAPLAKLGLFPILVFWLLKRNVWKLKPSWSDILPLLKRQAGGQSNVFMVFNILSIYVTDKFASGKPWLLCDGLVPRLRWGYSLDVGRSH